MIKINLGSRKQSVFAGDSGGSESPKGLTSLSKLKVDLSAGGDLPLVGMGIFAVVFLVGYYGSDYYKTQELLKIEEQITKITEQRSKLSQKLAEKETDRAEQLRLQKNESEVKNKIAAVTKLTEGRKDSAKLLNYLSEVIPEAVWLKDITHIGNEIGVKGQSTDFAQISEFVKRLQTNAFFEKVELKGSQLDAANSSAFKSFEIVIIKREIK